MVFNGLDGRNDQTAKDLLGAIRALFPDKKKDFLRLLLLHDIRKRFSAWSECNDALVGLTYRGPKLHRINKFAGNDPWDIVLIFSRTTGPWVPHLCSTITLVVNVRGRKAR